MVGLDGGVVAFGIAEGSGVALDAAGAAPNAFGAAQDAAGVGQDAAGAGQDVAGAAQDVTGAAEDATGESQDVAGVLLDAAGAAQEAAAAAPGCGDGCAVGGLAPPNTDREIDHRVSSKFFCAFSFTSFGCFMEFMTDLKTLLVISNTFSGKMATGD